MNVVISPLNVELGEELASTELVDCLGNKRGDISVLLGPFVDWSIVLDRS